MRRFIAIIDRDRDYSQRLASYINSKHQVGIHATAFTGIESYREYIKQAAPEIILINEEMKCRLGTGDENNATVIVLSEDGFVSSEYDVTTVREHPGNAAVFKYRPADMIVREIMHIYAADKRHGLTCVKVSESLIVGVYSPVGRCGKSNLSLALALIFSEQKRTVLISLEECGAMFAGNIKNVTDLSDIIYSFIQKPADNPDMPAQLGDLKSAVYGYGKLDFIPPARCPEDVMKLSSSQLERLIRNIVAQGGYEAAVIDFGMYARRSAELFDVCNRIYMPVLSDPVSRAKINDFMQYLKRDSQTEYGEKLIQCELPDTGEIFDPLGNGGRGFMKHVQKLPFVMDDRKGEQDI